jgi:hypothetical protein
LGCERRERFYHRVHRVHREKIFKIRKIERIEGMIMWGEVFFTFIYIFEILKLGLQIIHKGL